MTHTAPHKIAELLSMTPTAGLSTTDFRSVDQRWQASQSDGFAVKDLLYELGEEMPAIKPAANALRDTLGDWMDAHTNLRAAFTGARNALDRSDWVTLQQHSARADAIETLIRSLHTVCVREARALLVLRLNAEDDELSA